MIFQQIVSLGPSCRPKHQIKRFYGKHIAKGGVFDWQTTPDRALISYLRSDFRGMFNRADMTTGENGFVTNSRTGTTHPHDFPKDATEKDLHDNYAIARRRHEHRSTVTRSIMTNKLPTLFVLGARISVEAKSAISDYIAGASPLKPYMIIEETEDQSADWWGTDAIWDRFFTSFQIHQTYTAKAEYQLYRLRKSWEYMIPESLRVRLLARG